MIDATASGTEGQIQPITRNGGVYESTSIRHVSPGAMTGATPQARRRRYKVRTILRIRAAECPKAARLMLRNRIGDRFVGGIRATSSDDINLN